MHAQRSCRLMAPTSRPAAWLALASILTATVGESRGRPGHPCRPSPSSLGRHRQDELPSSMLQGLGLLAIRQDHVDVIVHDLRAEGLVDEVGAFRKVVGPRLHRGRCNDDGDVRPPVGFCTAHNLLKWARPSNESKADAQPISQIRYLDGLLGTAPSLLRPCRLRSCASVR